MNVRRMFSPFALPLMGILCLVAPGSEAATVTRSGDVVAVTMSPHEQAAASALFARSKTAAARVLSMIDRGKAGVDSAAVETLAPAGPVGRTAGGAAAPFAEEIARAAFAADWQAADEEILAQAAVPTGSFGVYTAYIVNIYTPLWNIYPHKWDGRLTFLTPTGAAICSATVISGNNIVTAAHCVYDTTNNRFYSNWVFAPAYRNGAAPFGTFAAQTCWVLTTWVNLVGSFSINTWTRYDVAVCKLRTNSVGQTINSAVGWAGRLWNASYTQLVFNSGYPGQNYRLVAIAPGPTQYLRACTAETFVQTTDTLGSGCSWGPGISGGSWLVGYQPFAIAGQVNSVNSGLFIGQPNSYGARFNSSNIVPLCTAAGC